MTDKQIHDEVLAELEFEPEVHPERIGVSVEDGVVTLSGRVDNYAQKLAAERVVRRVYSARAVVNHLEVHLPARDEVADDELARAALRVLDGLADVPRDSIRITVRNGHLELEGTVDWHFQRQAVHTALERLRGVRGVVDRIRVREAETPANVRELIEGSLRRSGLDTRSITVEVAGGRVILSGSVRSLRERDEAAFAAWRAAGVTGVENRLEVGP